MDDSSNESPPEIPPAGAPESPEVASLGRFPTVEAEWQAGLIVVICWVYVCGLTLADPDLWGHTLYGLRAVEQGVAVERTDPFSYTVPDAEWVNHEWLVEWQFGWLWREFGNIGLWWWRNVVVAIPFLVAWFVARRGGASVAGLAAAVIPAAMCLSQFTCFIRPQLVTYALLAITLAITRRDTLGSPRDWAMWMLPPLLVLWTNLHGGFIAGLGILFIVWCDLARRAFLGEVARQRVVVFGVVALLCALGTLLTPYGIGLHRMLWYHLGTHQIVSEWKPIWATRMAPAYFVPFLLPLLAFVGSRRWRWLDLAIVLVVAWQGAMHLKHVALLAVTCLVLLPVPMTDVVRKVFPRIHEQWSGPGRRPVRWAAVGWALVMVGLLQFQSVVPMWRQGIKPWDVAVSTRGYVPGVPLRAIRHIQRHGLRGNVITDYGWAQFVIWHLHPESRIAFDGRYRTVYPAEMERQFVEFLTVDPDSTEPLALLDEHDSSIVLLSNRREETIGYLRNRSDWTLVYDDDQATVFVHEDRVVRSTIAAESDADATEWEVFPGRPANPAGNTSVSIR